MGKVSIQLVSLARSDKKDEKLKEQAAKVSIQLVSLARRDAQRWELTAKNPVVSIQLVSLARRDLFTTFGMLVTDMFPFN